MHIWSFMFNYIPIFIYKISTYFAFLFLFVLLSILFFLLFLFLFSFVQNYILTINCGAVWLSSLNFWDLAFVFRFQCSFTIKYINRFIWLFNVFCWDWSKWLNFIGWLWEDLIMKLFTDRIDFPSRKTLLQFHVPLFLK